MLEQQLAQSLSLLCVSLPCFFCVLHLPTYLMNLIGTVHWRLKLLVGSHLSHPHRRSLSFLFRSPFDVGYALQFISRNCPKIDKITTTDPTQWFQKGNIMPIPARATARVQSKQEVAKWQNVFRDRITDLQLCESFMLKGALLLQCHIQCFDICFEDYALPDHQ